MRPLRVSSLSSHVALFAVACSTAGAGCQYFFPTPIDQEESAKLPAARAVHSVGTPFVPGEVIKADVYLDSIRAGTGELRASAPCTVKGKQAVRIDLSGGTTGLARML